MSVTGWNTVLLNLSKESNAYKFEEVIHDLVKHLKTIENNIRGKTNKNKRRGNIK